MDEISVSTLKRLPIYLNYLKHHDEDKEYISATYIANALALGQVQVRKDLAVISAVGKPKTGYSRVELIAGLESILGYNTPTKAVIVGVGNMGKALMQYNGFDLYGISIEAGFDTDEGTIGSELCGKKVYDVSCVEDYIKENEITIAILAVPSQYAQEVASRVVKSGVRGIWNFTRRHLVTENGVAVVNENMAASLAQLNLKMNNGIKI